MNLRPPGLRWAGMTPSRTQARMICSYSHLFDDDLETLADNMDARYGAAQESPKPDSGDVVDLEKKRTKEI